MNALKEKISCESFDKDAWVCLCQNTPASYGFYPCDTTGKEIEPIKGSNWVGYYVCGKCNRIIDQDTLEVIRTTQLPSQGFMLL
jgi:hypothetical protein